MVFGNVKITGGFSAGEYDSVLRLDFLVMESGITLHFDLPSPPTSTAALLAFTFHFLVVAIVIYYGIIQ